MQYVAPCHPASSSIGALRADFVTPGIDNLVINKGSRLEVYALDPNGLRLEHTIPLNGIAIAVNALKLPGQERSSLLVLTASNRLFALGFNEERGIYTETTISIAEHSARPADLCQTIVVDPETSLVGVHAYNGLFRVVPLLKEVKKKRGRKSEADKLKEANDYELDLERSYNIRLPEHNVHSVCIFNPPNSPPCLVVLHDDYRGQKILKVRPILLSEKDFADEETTLTFTLDDYGSELIVPVPGRGVIVVGEAKAVFVALTSEVVIDTKGKRRSSTTSTSTPKRTVECALPLGAYTAFAPIDSTPNHFLLGDLYGELHVLEIGVAEDGRITGLTAESIGRTTSATALVYLANRFLYVASHYGDSQLLRLPTSALPQASDAANPTEDVEMSTDTEETAFSDSIQIINTFNNLAPIVDFCVVDTEFGQSHVVTCSGGYNDGSLRIVSHGVGLTDLANLEMANVQRVWAVPLQPSADGHDNALVIGFVNETRILKFGQTEEEGIEEIDALPGFDFGVPTLDVFVMQNNLCQITKDGVNSAQASAQWSPSSSSAKITVAAHDKDSAVIGAADGTLSILRWSDGVCSLVATAQLPQEAACLALHSIAGRSFVLAGLWSTHMVMALDAETLRNLTSIQLPTNTLMRSILPITYDDDDTTIVYIGQGDGTLISIPLEYDHDEFILHDEARKSIALGSRPIVLADFQTEDGHSVFVSSDQPTVISRNKGRLNYASVNVQNISAVATFNSQAYPSSLVFGTSEGIRIGRIDEIQSLHIRTILLGGDQPRRIAHSPKTKAFGILCIREVIDQSSGTILKTGSFKIVDDTTFDILHDHEFEEDEQGLSVSEIVVGSTSCFVVGSATVLPSEQQAKRGKLRAFHESESRTFGVLASADCKGAPYALAQLPNGLLSATVNAKVNAYQFDEEEKELRECASWGGTFLATNLTTLDNLVLVGDALRSVTLLRFDTEGGVMRSPCFWEEAREFYANGIMATALLSDTSCVAADMDMNVFTMQRSENAGKPGPTLQQAGLYHIGEVVTRIKHGSLVPKFAQSSVASSQQLLYATSNGTIGIIAQLDNAIGQSLYELQRNMRRVVPSLGSLEHSKWRKYRADHRTADSVGFIDGAFVERWADLSQTERASVFQGNSEAERITLTQEEVSGLVEACELMH